MNNDIYSTLDDIKEIIAWKDKRIESLTKENQELKSEHYKDETLAKMQSDLERIRKDYFRGFPITEDEGIAINKWIKAHCKEKHNGIISGGAIGGSFTYSFIPTSIGVIGEIQCSCGDSYCFK